MSGAKLPGMRRPVRVFRGSDLLIEDAADVLVRGKRRRKPAVPGDVLVFQFYDGSGVLGRISDVSDEDLVLGPSGLFVYVYDHVVEDAAGVDESCVPWEVMTPDRLLLPPEPHGGGLWSQGWVRVVPGRPLVEADRVPMSLYNSMGFYDQEGHCKLYSPHDVISKTAQHDIVSFASVLAKALCEVEPWDEADRVVDASEKHGEVEFFGPGGWDNSMAREWAGFFVAHPDETALVVAMASALDFGLGSVDAELHTYMNAMCGRLLTASLLARAVAAAEMVAALGGRPGDGIPDEVLEALSEWDVRLSASTRHLALSVSYAALRCTKHKGATHFGELPEPQVYTLWKDHPRRASRHMAMQDLLRRIRLATNHKVP